MISICRPNPSTSPRSRVLLNLGCDHETSYSFVRRPQSIGTGEPFPLSMEPCQSQQSNLASNNEYQPSGRIHKIHRCVIVVYEDDATCRDVLPLTAHSFFFRGDRQLPGLSTVKLGLICFCRSGPLKVFSIMSSNPIRYSHLQLLPSFGCSLALSPHRRGVPWRFAATPWGGMALAHHTLSEPGPSGLLPQPARRYYSLARS